MNAERVRTFLLRLPHVVETEQWSGLVFWVGDKAVGGKMFVLLSLDGLGPVISYPAGQERFSEMVERDGLVPAPYLARIWWVAAERWDALRDREWEEELRAGHGIVYERLPAKVKATLGLPDGQLKEAVAAGRRKKAAWEVAQAEKKAKAGRPTRRSPMSLD